MGLTAFASGAAVDTINHQFPSDSQTPSDKLTGALSIRCYFCSEVYRGKGALRANRLWKGALVGPGTPSLRYDCFRYMIWCDPILIGSLNGVID